MRQKTYLLLATVLGLGMASPAIGEDHSLGEEAFRVSCAVCHGSDGRGGGEFASALTVKPSNLTLLSANNDGVFPYLEVFRVVDGRTTIQAHGTSVMPIWGDYFEREIGETAGPYGKELLVRARIVALVDYVESLQD